LTKLRVEVVLTEADADIIEELQASGLQRATFFKMAARAYMRHKEEEQFDVRVKRLLDEVLAQRGDSGPIAKNVKPKQKLGFGGKRIVDDSRTNPQ